MFERKTRSFGWSLFRVHRMKFNLSKPKKTPEFESSLRGLRRKEFMTLSQ
jgi:hypothetical protein